MCTREEVQNIVDKSEHRLMEEIRDLETRITDDIVLKYNQAIALVHKTSPDTDSRIAPLEKYIKEHQENNKWVIRWLAGSVIAFLSVGFSMVWWASGITSGLQHNAEQIQKISSDSLIKQDAQVIQEQLKSMQKEIENHTKN